jgi:penicillin-binding protein 2
MKRFRGIALGLVLLASCVPATILTPTSDLATPISPSPTFSPPMVLTTTPAAPPAPDVTASQFMASWEAGDYAAMYELLTPLTQASLEAETFRERYQAAAQALTLQGLSAQLLAALSEDHRATVAFRVTFETALYGDLVRDNTLELHLEQGRWRVAWTEAAILPELAGGNTLYTDYEQPGRGNLYDRNAKALAAQTEAVAVGLIPGQVVDGDALANTLAPLLGLRPEEIHARSASAQLDWYVPLGELAAEEFQANAAVLNGLPGVVLTPYPTRYYVDGGLAAQALGYLAPLTPENLAAYLAQGYPPDARVGAAGLERSQQAALAGGTGGTLYVFSPAGQLVSILAEAATEPAQAVVTTLDRELQRAAQLALGDFAGAIVALNPETGEILAMVSQPSYDNNLFDPANPNAGLLSEVLADTREPLLNRATQGQYPLGSVFKIVTMAAALESGQYTRDSRLDCTYAWAGLGPDAVRYDWKEGGHGVLSLLDGLVESCDTWFYEIGLNLDGADSGQLPAMARAFGLGQPTGVDAIPEVAGLVPDPAWKLTERAEAWWAGDAVNLAIGQGDLLVTPLQVARLLAAVANGGRLYRPQLIHHIGSTGSQPGFTFGPEVQGTLPIAPATLATLQEGLLGVTSWRNGTARNRFLGLSVPVAGKTGTAQAPGETSLPHSWFAGYTLAGQGDKSDLVIVVLAENAGEGSAIAAPIFRRVVEQYFLGRAYTLYPWEVELGVVATPEPGPSP